jgi:hypothetical protein
MEQHKFKVGQTVELLHKPEDKLGKFEITRIMPIEHGQRLYRIKCLADGHERVALESELK